MARTPKIVEDRREQIIDAAMRVFAQKGFARATNRDIAQEAGITTGLIYYYFKSKEDLLKEALEERSPVQMMAQISPEMLEQPPEILLPLIFMRLLSIVESEQFLDMIRIFLPEMLHGTADLTPLLLEFFQRVITFLGNYLQIQINKGTLRSDLAIQETVQVIASGMIGMVLRRQILHDPNVLQYTHEEIAQVLMGTFLRGMQA